MQIAVQLEQCVCPFWAFEKGPLRCLGIFAQVPLTHAQLYRAAAAAPAVVHRSIDPGSILER